jgi:hypothetical protein
MLELAARSVGGLCSRALHFPGGKIMEELRAGQRSRPARPVAGDAPVRPSGVFMLPVPRSGVLRTVEGRDRAAAVPGIAGLTITDPVGQRVLRLGRGPVPGFHRRRSRHPARRRTGAARRPRSAPRGHRVAGCRGDVPAMPDVCSASMMPDDAWLAAAWEVVIGELPAPPASVVEVGCGPLGGLVPVLRSAGYAATGVDPAAPPGSWYCPVEFERYDPAFASCRAGGLWPELGRPV